MEQNRWEHVRLAEEGGLEIETHPSVTTHHPEIDTPYQSDELVAHP